MLQPLVKDDAFLTDIATAVTDDEHFTIWWLGQSGFLLKWRQHSVLLDPLLSKAENRTTVPVIDPAKLENIDIVAVSNPLADQLDPETLTALASTNPELTMLLPEAAAEFASRSLNVPPARLIGIAPATTQTIGEFNFTAIAASAGDPHRGEFAPDAFLGYLIEFGSWRIFHSGNIRWHAGLVPALSTTRPHLMLLPINAGNPSSMPNNLNGAEAATLARACNSEMAIPSHYGTFADDTASPEEFAATCERIRQPHQVLLNGESWTSRPIDA